MTLCLAVVMICVGSVYWDQADCRLGASSYLYYGGVFSLTITVIISTFYTVSRQYLHSIYTISTQ